MANAMTSVESMAVVEEMVKTAKVFLSSDVADGAKQPRTLYTMDELKQMMCSLPRFPRSTALDLACQSVPILAGLNAGLPDDFAWIHCKHFTTEETREVLSWLSLHHFTEHKIVSGFNEDAVEYFPNFGYVFVSLVAWPRSSRYRDVNDRVYLYVLAYDNTIISFCNGDFAGEEDVCLKAMQPLEHTPVREASAGVATIFSALINNTIIKMQTGVSKLLVRADQLDELMLEVMPSRVDQNDLLLRLKHTRSNVAKYHVEMLLKERLLKHLLLPAMQCVPACRDPQAVERFQQAVTVTRRGIEKLRKCRDLINMSNMNLISGVSARLLKHCHFMDYMNRIQTQLALVVMPVNLIPSLWASNLKVPFASDPTTKSFWAVTAVTIGLLAISVGLVCIDFFRYKAPSALINTFN